MLLVGSKESKAEVGLWTLMEGPVLLWEVSAGGQGLQLGPLPLSSLRRGSPSHSSLDVDLFPFPAFCCTEYSQALAS